MQFRGTWNQTATYPNNSVVLYRGSPFIATAPVSARFQPPKLPWIALSSASATTESQLTQLRQSIISQAQTISALQSRILQLEARPEPPSPQTLQLAAGGITLTPQGSTLPYGDVLTRLFDVPVKIGDLSIMAFRSALGRMLARIVAEEAATVDISANRLPAVAGLIVNNESLDAARELAQALKDAAQDVSGALMQLQAAAAAADISAVSARVDALEAAPGFDSTALEARVTAAETAIGGKADQSAVDTALAAKAAAADLSALDARVVVEEAASAAAASRLDAVEAALPSKVAQADYDVYVAATDAAVAAAASAADAAQDAADAAAVVAAAAEVKGLVSKLTVEDITTVGISGAYWAETIQDSIASAADAGKVASYAFDAPHAEIPLPAGSPVAGAVRRIHNAHASAVLPVSLGGASYEIVAGETAVFQYNGSAWRLL